MFDPFYFSSIRKYVILFGTLFNNIRITRNDSAGNLISLIKVPISYGPKDKMMARVIQDPDINKGAAIQLPIMSFEMTNFAYDGSRKRQTTHRVANLDPDNNSNNRYQFSPVPYNIGFTLNIYAKSQEDGTKIVEQIIPYFTPDWTTSVILIPEMEIKMDIPLILNDIQLNDAYDGNFDIRRALVWTMSFTMKGYFFGPVKKTTVIKFANTEFFLPKGNLQDAVGNSIPTSYVTVQPGLTANGTPTSNSELSIPVADIEASDDYGYVITIGNING